MRVLLIGSGGREHALAWKLAQEAEVHACPGNPGILETAELHPVSGADHAGIVELAKRLRPDFVLVGPENPLIEGLADRLRGEGIAVFGPNREAAQLEGSKAFAKAIMSEAGVPTARFETFTDPILASDFASRLFEEGAGAVVKASGPALGKGAVVCEKAEEAREIIHRMMVEREFGDSGATVVVEERLPGPEFSLLTLVGDHGFCSLPAAQDYKSIFDGGRGPNTGGMGSYSPVAWVDEDLVRQTEEQVVAPIWRTLRAKGIPYRGVLFSGLMMKTDTANCLEYNVRFGDPETQSVMLRLGSGLGDAMLACAQGAPIPRIETLDNAAVSVVLASEGYPGSVKTNRTIEIPRELDKDVRVFHAGTKLIDGQLVTAGGRVLAVSAYGSSVAEARAKAYAAADRIEFLGKQYRTDIALTGRQEQVAL